jgi:hypothetical protein
MQNGKGDSPRKKSVSQEVWDINWEKIFRSKEQRNVQKENWKTDREESRQEKRKEKGDY